MNRSIPTYEDGKWSVTTFKDDDEFIDYLISIFKIPGEYDFDETAFIFNHEARKFNDQGFYCNAPFR